MSSTIGDLGLPLAILIGIATLGYLASRKLSSHDPREPPLAPSAIPIIGHLIGLSRSKFNYYSALYHQSRSPISTLPIPGQKMYIVNTPELVQAVQKQHKILAFPPIAVKFTKNVCGSSKEANEIVAINANGDDGDHGVSMATYAGMHAALKPGPDLDDMNRDMIQEIATLLDKLQPKDQKPRRISLYSWLRASITTATTRSVYGPLNPYEDQAVADAFWEFEKGFMAVVIGILPWLFARRPIAARKTVSDGFLAYFEAGGVHKASVLAKNRYKAMVDNNLQHADISKFEVAESIAIMVNTAPAAFWTLFLVHSHPGLLEELRVEIDACTRTTPDGKLKTIDITTLKQNCPLLLSAYQEVLRHRSMGTSVREVMQDTYLDKYLLKKGAMLQMPSRVIHQDASLWGADYAEFNPRRFLAENKKNRPSDVCFRAFGGGKTLCPGRHFATNEVLAVVAAFVARLDMRPADGAEWKLPTAENTNVAAVIMEPDADVQVEITTRKGFEGVRWAVSLDGSDKIFAMVTEDGVETE
ncbi:putative cytochrome P450 [Podospora didyma]|uniref:Cytochrome P450 n=1 Tax=Podospora didyma TaxID=330526 RepID=A0AAE0KB08_9PEZI|nr:putative cytochrome P450 [Podospora didyma]